MAWGDANGDGLDDVYLGGAAGQAGMLFVRDAGGKFSPVSGGPWGEDLRCEDMGAVWLDADSDGDLDLYVVSGGVECNPNDAVLQDRLYINEGNLRFTRARTLCRKCSAAAASWPPPISTAMAIWICSWAGG